MFNFGSMPSMEEVSRRAKERHDAAKACVNAPGRFNGVSLGAWIDEAKKALIPFVPINKIGEIPRDVLMRIEEPTESDCLIWEDLNKAEKSLDDTSMTRWDACSTSELKYVMGQAGQPKEERIAAGKQTTPCMRVFDIHHGYAGDVIPIWSRPWIEAMEFKGFPVEFRVFVKDSKILGIANYYPQVTLPESVEIGRFVQQCEVMANQFIKHLDGSNSRPWLMDCENKFNPEKVNATMDFIVTKNGAVLFLEAGPPFGVGAHPCSFIDREISGVALGLAEGVKLR